ncbi:MAG: uracil phosphoribosyltransferase, partial [Microcystis sp.]
MVLQLRVYVPEHPLVKHWLAIARDQNTPSVLFK